MAQPPLSQQIAAGLQGRLAIGCGGSAAYSLVPKLASALREELPSIGFAFRGEMLVPDQVAALLGREIDLALLRPPAAEASAWQTCATRTSSSAPPATVR